MKGCLVVTHGIKTGDRRADEWMPKLIGRLIKDLRIDAKRIIQHRWGYASAFSVRVPFYGLMYRMRKVKQLQRLVLELRKKFGTVNILAHSMGTKFSHNSMTGDKGPHAFYDRIIYMGGVVSSRENFLNETGHFGDILNMWSDKDDIVQWSTFGHAGYKGFAHADEMENVTNVDMTPMDHGDYLEDGPAWDQVVRFLRAK